MTLFGIVLVLVLLLMLLVGWDATRTGELNGNPVPATLNRALFIIVVLIIGILTVGTGSLW